MKEIINKLVDEKKTAIIKFYADWCGPCNLLGKIIEEIKQEDNNINIIEIDVDENDDLVAEYNVGSIPMMVFYKNGKIIKTHVGLMTKEEIKEAIYG